MTDASVLRYPEGHPEHCSLCKVRDLEKKLAEAQEQLVAANKRIAELEQGQPAAVVKASEE